MSDDRSTPPGDPARIDLSEPYEVRDWTNSLGVNELQLREAVEAVGDAADRVRDYLSHH